jgi:DNA-directed RNA polymerase specialized sigma24 family protein
MSVRVDDAAVKELLRRFREGDGKSLSSALDALSLYIYNYPRIVFGSPPDQCGDFYEYILERFETILLGYRESPAKFLTWFTVVLRNRYLNFVRERKTKAKHESRVTVVSIDSAASCGRSLHEVIGDSRWGHEGADAGEAALVDRIVRDLKDTHRVYFHLFFVESVRPEDIAFLSIFLNRPVSALLRGLREIRLSMEEKYRLKSRLNRRLNELYFELLAAQKEKNEERVRKVKKKREKVFIEYKRVKLNPAYETISKFLGLPIGTVSTGIMRMKRAAAVFLEEGEMEERHETLPIS